MDDIRANDKLYNWRYGPMTVTDIVKDKHMRHEDYVRLSVDDTDGVAGPGTYEFRTREQQKVFKVSYLNHLIHRTPSNAVLLNNIKSDDGSRKPWPLLCDHPLLHDGLWPIVAKEDPRIKVLVESRRERDRTKALLDGIEPKLRSYETELEVIKNSERDFPDHQAYHKALTDIALRIEEERSRVKPVEDVLDQCQARIDEILGGLVYPEDAALLKWAKLCGLRQPDRA